MFPSRDLSFQYGNALSHIYAGVPFWSRKVFEGVYSHVIDLSRKSDFGPFNFLFENYDHVSKSDFGPLNWSASFRWSFGPLSAWVSIELTTLLTTHPTLFNSPNFRFWSRFLLRVEIGPISEIRTFERWTKIGIGHTIINFEELKN